MENHKNNENKKSGYYLRILAGTYLLYLAYGLFGDYKNGRISNEILILGAIFVFFAAGLFLIYTSIRYLIVNNKKGSTEDGEVHHQEIGIKED